MPFYRRLPAIVVGLGILTFAWAAQAQRVALVRPSAADAVLLESFNRLSAELHIQDFEVAILDTYTEPSTEPSTAAELAEVAKRTASVAAVTFARHGDRTSVDVFIGERGNTPSRVQTIEPVKGLDVPTVLAIRTVDLLRTSLRDFGGGEPRPPPTPPPPSAEAKPVPPPPPPLPPPSPGLWMIRAEGLMLWDRPTLGMALGASLGLARTVAKDVSVGIAVAGPIVLTRNWATSNGEASVRQEMGWLEIKGSPWAAGPLRFGASAGAGVHRLEVQGVRPRVQSVGNEWWSFAGMVGLHADLHLAGNAAFGITIRGVGLAKRVAVAIAEDQAVIQFPLLSASAGLLVGF